MGNMVLGEIHIKRKQFNEFMVFQLEKLLVQEDDPEKLKFHRSPSSVSSSFKVKKKIPVKPT